MLKTSTVTVDNLSLHAIVAPSDCTRLIIRENASDTAPVAYDIAAPTSSDSLVRMMPQEATVFIASENQIFQYNQTVGYIQTVSGTKTFQVIAA